MQAILTNFVVDIKNSPLLVLKFAAKFNKCFLPKKNVGGKWQTQIVALTINTTKVTKRKKTAQTDCLLFIARVVKP